MNAHDRSPYLGREPIAGLEHMRSGKVRDVYALDADRLLFVTTDRVSAFDVVMREGIPDKGRVLTRIAEFWFDRTRDIVANHLLSTDVAEVPGLDDETRAALEGRVMIVRRAEPTPVEWVIRGYLAGSGWKEYQRSGTVCSIPLPPGLRQAQRLPEPLLTPTTKSDERDEPISPERVRELVGDAVFERAREASLALFRRAAEVLERHGLILADTKFEFGIADGETILIDEALTPDSSRLWAAEAWALDTSPPSFDKQILRDWLETTGWDKNPPPPALAPEVVERVRARYLEVCERLTGEAPVGVRA